MEEINKKEAQAAFLSKKLSQAQRKYSPYDRELLAIYTAIKHFRHVGKQTICCILCTDYKPLIYDFNKNQLQSSPRQARHLEFISSFTTDIRYVTGKRIKVADALG